MEEADSAVSETPPFLPPFLPPCLAPSVGLVLWPSAEVAPSVVDSTTAGVTEVALVEDAGVAVLLSEAAAVAVLVTVG